MSNVLKIFEVRMLSNANANFVTSLKDMLLPPPKKEVMFLVRSVCLSVCLSVRRITCKLVNGY